MDKKLSDLFNEEGLKTLTDAARSLGLPSAEALLSTAFGLVAVAQQAKDQGKELYIATIKNGALVPDVKIGISETPTGGVDFKMYKNSDFDIKKLGK
jgi:hypothetical protein